MALTITDKQKIIKSYQTVTGDTGSPEVQVALLTKRIEKLTEHLKDHPHDVHSRRGLLSMISKRRRILSFLAQKEEERYKEIVGKLKISK